mgnify:CR=1 FL=1|jgi:hypothetical protein|tara:strand:+ start:518 stop:772 length:255 start_codon:yes stop_codon:yes gene_type:complete
MTIQEFTKEEERVGLLLQISVAVEHHTKDMTDLEPNKDCLLCEVEITPSQTETLCPACIEEWGGWREDYRQDYQAHLKMKGEGS